MTEADQKRSFASWKLGWLDVLMAGLDHREYRIATCLLQRANERTRTIVPSQAYLAAYLGCSVRAIERGIANLVADGWIEKRRARRHLPNAYRFVEAKREQIERDLTERLANFKAERRAEWDPTDVTGPDPTDVTGPPASQDPTEVSLGPDRSVASDPTDVGGKHLIEHLSSPSERSVPVAARGTNVIEVSPELRALLSKTRTGTRVPR